MNKELKTLKDIEFTFLQRKPIDISGYKPETYSKYLRQEAIKWVKKLEKELNNDKLKGLKNKKEKIIGLCATLEWITMFFNLTDDDLK